MKKIIKYLLLLCMSGILAAASGHQVYHPHGTVYRQSDQLVNHQVANHPIETSYGHHIWGRLYKPRQIKPKQGLPLIIYVHGYGSSYRSGVPYAQYFADRGYAVYTFDFFGGGPRTKSGGTMLDMTVKNEADDLGEIINQLKLDPQIDADRIYLLGSSQGGFVSTLVASERDDIKSLLLIYPAFVLGNLVEDLYPEGQEIPETFKFLGLEVSDDYALALSQIDMEQVMASLTIPVLIFHGDHDQIIPIASSYHALDLFGQSQLVTYQGQGHGFDQATRSKAMEVMEEFLNYQEEKKEELDEFRDVR
ncbi:alpha/beta hydrolase family protein [Eremococcus coleocola]|uniref:Phospholipase/carboxylesterase n=1 Tax=Eremococcus coleocola ACS-139-V-Col8 TaxID=908337 RepID=E4KRD9_9LACT|nr:alpha/beta fold hydrolase [Eremococcus coleocola]EFR30507.1 phospholipase/carboxylesterase [Eremococcus coleocola ACS-139-V-Col8]